MGKIVKREYEKNTLYHIENEMVTCQLFHSVRILNIIHFEGSILGFMLISQAIKQDKSLIEHYTKQDHRKKIIESLDSVKAFNDIKSFSLNLLEKAYQDLFQAFESSVHDCLRSIFFTYPAFIKFLNKKSISYSDLSDKQYLIANVELINKEIDITIEKLSKGKTLLQQIGLLNKLPINIQLTTEDQHMIDLFTKNRNLLVHHDGRITRSFIEWIEEAEGQETNFEVGQYFIRDYLSQSPLNTYKDLVDRTVNYITNCISSAKNELNNFNELLIMNNRQHIL